MKIVYVTMQFPVPSETFASSDIKYLSDIGCDVKVFALRVKNKHYNKLCLERNLTSLDIESSNFINLLKGFYYILSSPIKFFVLLRWCFSASKNKKIHLFKSIALFPRVFSIYESIRKINPHIVHLFWGHYPSLLGFMIHKFCKDTSITMFLGAHDLEVAYNGSSMLSFKADYVFTHSYSNIPKLEILGVDLTKVVVVHRGIEVKEKLLINSSPKIAKLENSYVTAGRLIYDKGFDDVIKFFYHVVQHEPRSTLKIIGDGPDKVRLLGLVEELGLSSNVVFTGFLDSDSVFNELIKASFFVLMSRYKGERLPNVVKEAMLCRCICITTDTEGIGELITHGVDGFIVPKSDIDQAFHITSSCLADESRCNVIRSRAQAKIINNFDVSKSMGVYYRCWKKLIFTRERKKIDLN